MENTNATVTFFHDTRRAKKNDVYPVKLTVYFEGQKFRYKTGIDLTEAEWTKIHSSNLRDDSLRIIKRKLYAKKDQAEKLIETIEPFSFEMFEKLFFQEKAARKSNNLKDLFDTYISKLEGEDRIGSASLYRTTINSLTGFRPILRVSDISKAFLEDYEQYLKGNGISPTTAGIYFRHLRAIMNIAISDGLLSGDKYPFKGFAIPSSRNVKKALEAEHIKKLLNYSSEDNTVQIAVDYWLFSYLSNGINFTDICYLKPEDIRGEFFTFFRAKTKNTKKRDKRPIQVPLLSKSLEIIQRRKSNDETCPFLFPILNAGLTAKQEKYKIQDFIDKVNKAMKKVAKEIGFEGKIGTYVARHSHATILKRSGAPSELIKENLGHSSLTTTENYLDDFEDHVKKDYASRLTDL